MKETVKTVKEGTRTSLGAWNAVAVCGYDNTRGRRLAIGESVLNAGGELIPLIPLNPLSARPAATVGGDSVKLVLARSGSSPDAAGRVQPS